MKVLFVSEYYPPTVKGGGEINLFILAKALVEQGITVTVLTSHQVGFKTEEVISGVRVIRQLSSGNNPQQLWENFKRSFMLPKSIVKAVNKLCTVEQFDLIHFIGVSVIAAPQLKPLSIPLVATIESYPALCPKGDRMYRGRGECKIVCSWNKFVICQSKSPEIGKMNNQFYLKYNLLLLGYIYNYYKRLRRSLGFCHIIAISHYVQQVLQLHGLTSTVIPNAIELELFQKTKSNPLAFNQPVSVDHKLKIVYIGSLTRYKGPQMLLLAIKGLNCRVDLYGEGPLKLKLQQLILKYHLDAEIHVPVPYNDIPKVYARADLIVFPSLWPEPFGRISLEAMSAGKPVIASNIGGIKELIVNNTGQLYPPLEVLSLRAAILRFISQTKTSLVKAYSPNRSEKFVEENFSKSVVVHKLIDYYKSILDNQ